MKVYGYDDTGPYRGDLIAAHIESSDLNFGMEAIAFSLDWVYASTKFTEARDHLVAAMKDAGTDIELVDQVRRSKASHVPVMEA